MMGKGRLRDIEERYQLADADHAGVLAQHVDELQADRVTERLGDLGHPKCVISRDIGIDDGLAAALAGCSLLLWHQLHIDQHRSTYITNTDLCQCNTMPS